MEVVVRPLEKIIYNLKSRGWCKLPYPGHPKGCPNFGKRDICPPKAPLIMDVADPPFLLVAVKFELKYWAAALKKKHPDWSDKQTRCCLYWQGMVRKVLREKCEQLLHEDEVVFYNPEAMGVQVFSTCREVGIYLERNPQNTVWKIAIIAKKRLD